MALNYPIFHTAYRQMVTPKGGSPTLQESDMGEHKPWTTAMRDIKPDDFSDDARLVRAAFWYHQVFLTDGRNAGAEELSIHLPQASPEILVDFGKNPTLSTRSLYTYYLPTALEPLRKGGKLSAVSGLREAMLILLASGCFDDLTKKYGQEKIRRISRVRKRRQIIDPRLLSNRWGLEDAFPPPDAISQKESLQLAARRVMAIIILHGWQRFRALRLVELRHIVVSSRFVEVIIPDDKGGPKMSRLPLYLLAPESDLQFIRDFIQTVSAHLPDSKTRLTEVAGFGIIEASGRGAKSAYRSVRRIFGPTHDGRRTGLSWAPVRVLVARNPELLDHPYFPENMKAHWWFSAEGLARFRKLLPSSQTDSVEIIRRIAGWTTYTQFFSTYCRNWHIILALSAL